MATTTVRLRISSAPASDTSSISMNCHRSTPSRRPAWWSNATTTTTWAHPSSWTPSASSDQTTVPTTPSAPASPAHQQRGHIGNFVWMAWRLCGLSRRSSAMGRRGEIALRCLHGTRRPRESDHVHFKNEQILKYDGTWNYGYEGILTNKERSWFKAMDEQVCRQRINDWFDLAIQQDWRAFYELHGRDVGIPESPSSIQEIKSIEIMTMNILLSLSDKQLYIYETTQSILVYNYGLLETGALLKPESILQSVFSEVETNSGGQDRFLLLDKRYNHWRGCHPRMIQSLCELDDSKQSRWMLTEYYSNDQSSPSVSLTHWRGQVPDLWI